MIGCVLVLGLVLRAVILGIGFWASEAPRAHSDTVMRLRELHERKDAGEITDREFALVQREILRERRDSYAQGTTAGRSRS